MTENTKHTKEIIFFILLTLGILYLIALLGYSDLENPFSGDMNLQKSTNYLGMVGAYVADFSLAIFGFSSYILLISLLWLGVEIYKESFRGFNAWRFVLKFLLFILFITISCGFFNSAISEFSGGWIGLEVNQLLSPLFGFGVNVLYIATIMIIFIVLTEISWFSTFATLLKGLTTIMLNIWRILVLISQKIHQLVYSKVSLSKPIINTTQIKPKNITPIIAKITPPPVITHTTTNQNYTDVLPTIDLLDSIPDNTNSYSEHELNTMSEQVIEKLADFGINVEITAITPGPVITSFELSLPAGVKASKVVGLDKDLARALLVESVRIIDVIPGKPVIGLEIPNAQRQIITLSEIISATIYQDSKAPLTMCLGKNVIGEKVVIDLAKTPHLLVAGATGMGKSIGLNAMILGILFKSNPQNVRMIMIDPKVVELAIYADIPHLLTPVVTDMNQAASSLFWCVSEMERRYALLAKFGVRNIDGFNNKIKEAKTKGKPILDPDFDATNATDDEVAPEIIELPLIVIVIDEYADMLGALAQEDRTKSKRTESFIIRLAQKARAAGMHLIIATQRPSVDVITGLIKSNVSSRIAFKVSSKIDSRTILDKSGAEQLLGMGDMLYMLPGKSQLTRVHGAFVSDDEIFRVVEFLKQNYPTNYIDGILNQISEVSIDDDSISNVSGELDPLYDEAVEIVISSGKASISSVQRRLRIGYNRAARIIEDMEAAGIVSSMNASGNRQILAPRSL